MIEGDRAVRKTIKTGYSNRGMVEVTSGLHENELVVTVGQASLKQDSRVSIIKQASNAELAAGAVEQSGERQGSEDAASD